MIDWAAVKRRQAEDAEALAAVAAGIGEYGAANACYRLALILRMEAEGIEAFVCPRCGKRSWNPDDIRERYCNNCHLWTGETLPNPPIM